MPNRHYRIATTGLAPAHIDLDCSPDSDPWTFERLIRFFMGEARMYSQEIARGKKLFITIFDAITDEPQITYEVSRPVDYLIALRSSPFYWKVSGDWQN